MKYCQKCLTPLCRKGIKYYQLFKFICESYQEDRETIEISVDFLSEDIDQEFDQAMEWLEKKGYILSTESDQDLITIKPMGLSISQSEEDYTFFPEYEFCICKYVEQKRISS